MRRVTSMIKWLLVTASLLWPSPSWGETKPPLESLKVVLWPEYDRPSVLVIYQAKLPDEINLPASVSLPIPSMVGEPHAVATRFEDGALLYTDYSRHVQGEWATIETETESLEVWVEFYADLQIEGQARKYTFVWPGGVEIGSLAFEVLQPLGAKNFRVDPPGEPLLASDGLTYYQSDLGPQGISSTVTIDLAYEKLTGGLSSDRPAVKDTPDLEQLEIALWPEFDRSAVLVIYRGVLASDAPLPTRISLPIPAGAGEPHAVATLGADGSLLDAKYTRQVEGDWALINVETESRGVWLEYYTDLIMDGSERNFTFVWPGGLNIKALGYEVQQPVGATDLKITPPGIQSLGDDGLLYLRRDLGPSTTASVLSISLAYAKANSELSVDSISTSPTLGRPTTTRGGIPNLPARLSRVIGPWIPWAIGGLGLALLVVGGFLFLRLRSERVAKPSPPRRKRARRRPTEAATQDIDASAIFCHSCGTQANVSDRFCRHCGTQLRH